MAITISIDGIDGCGKTTQIKNIEAKLKEAGLSVLVTKAIGSELHPATEKLRDIALNSNYKLSPHAQQLVFAANALILRQEILQKFDKEYDVILLDRGYYSFHAYGLPLVKDQTWLALVSDFVGFNRPQDITILLDIDPDVSYARARTRSQEKFSDGGHDVIEAQGIEYQQEVRSIFLYYHSINPNKIFKFDVTNKEPEEVLKAIMEHPVLVSIVDQLRSENDEKEA